MQLSNYDTAYFLGRGVEAFIHFINCLLCLHRYLKGGRVPFFRMLLLITSVQCLDCLVLVLCHIDVLDSVWYITVACLFHFSVMVYTVALVNRLSHFAFMYPNAKRIRWYWCFFAITISLVTLVLDCVSEIYPNFLIYFYISAVPFVLSVIGATAHIDYLIAKAVYTNSKGVSGEKVNLILSQAAKKLFFYWRIGLVTSVFGSLSYGVFSIFGRKAWLPTWALFLTPLVGFPFEGLHYMFELFYQGNLTGLLLTIEKDSSSVSLSVFKESAVVASKPTSGSVP